MAGVMMEGDEGKTVGNQTVPAIGGTEGRKGMSPGVVNVEVVASAHLTDGNRAEGVNYTEVPGVNVTTQPFPQGTRVSDSTPSDDIN